MTPSVPGPRSVPGYRIEGPLGTGSQGQVYAARNERTGERVALKRVPITAAETPDPAQALRRARSEAALLTELDHPNLIQLIEFVLVGGAAVLVLELAEGGSLTDLLERSGTLDPVEVAATLSPIAAALAHAHERGVLHSDVSPSNVLFTRGGQPKLADLGVARLIGTDCDALGTLNYLDPVVAAGGVPGPASDVFALGAVALQALTGSGPCRYSTDGSDGSFAGAVGAGGLVDDLDSRLQQLPGQLGPVLRRVLDPRPSRRGTAAQLSLDLRLAAGPVRPVAAVGRHSAEYAAYRLAAADSSRFDGVAHGAPPSAAQLTHLSRPRIRPVPVAPERRLHRLRRRLGCAGVVRWRAAGRPSRFAVLTSVAALLGIIAMTLLFMGAAPHRDNQAAAAAGGSSPRLVGRTVASLVTPSRSTGSPATSSPSTGSHASGSPATSSPATDGVPSKHQPMSSRLGTGSGPSEQQPATLLAALAAARIHAYQLRQPELLAQVYAPGQLLAQDTQQLIRLIPPGCRLAGLHGGFTDVTVAAASVGRIEVRAVATLGEASLLCGSVLRGRTPAATQALRLVMVNTGAGFRIASQSAAPGPS